MCVKPLAGLFFIYGELFIFGGMEGKWKIIGTNPIWESKRFDIPDIYDAPIDQITDIPFGYFEIDKTAFIMFIGKKRSHLSNLFPGRFNYLASRYK